MPRPGTVLVQSLHSGFLHQSEDRLSLSGPAKLLRTLLAGRPSSRASTPLLVIYGGNLARPGSLPLKLPIYGQLLSPAMPSEVQQARNCEAWQALRALAAINEGTCVLQEGGSWLLWSTRKARHCVGLQQVHSWDRGPGSSVIAGPPAITSPGRKAATASPLFVERRRFLGSGASLVPPVEEGKSEAQQVLRCCFPRCPIAEDQGLLPQVLIREDHSPGLLFGILLGRGPRKCSIAMDKNIQ